MNLHRVADDSSAAAPAPDLVVVQTAVPKELAARLDRLPGASRAEKLRRAVLALLVAESHLAGG